VIKVYQLLALGRWFSPGTPASSTTKPGRHDIAEILLKVALKHQKIKSFKNLKITHLYLPISKTYNETCMIPIESTRSSSIIHQHYRQLSKIFDLIDFCCFNAIFSNISAISWRPVLVMEEAGVSGENHRPWASKW